MTTLIERLQPLCSQQPESRTAQPFAINTKRKLVFCPRGGKRVVVATDGFILVGVASEDEAPRAPMELMDTSIASWMLEEMPKDPVVTVLPILLQWAGESKWFAPCGACDGTGRVRLCAKCAGEGEVECECDSCGDLHIADCDDCGGKKTTPGKSDPCGNCAGTGKTSELTTPGIPGLVADVIVDKRRLARMLSTVDRLCVERKLSRTCLAWRGRLQDALYIGGTGWRALVMRLIPAELALADNAESKFVP